MCPKGLISTHFFIKDSHSILSWLFADDYMYFKSENLGLNFLPLLSFFYLLFGDICYAYPLTTFAFYILAKSEESARQDST